MRTSKWTEGFSRVGNGGLTLGCQGPALPDALLRKAYASLYLDLDERLAWSSGSRSTRLTKCTVLRS